MSGDKREHFQNESFFDPYPYFAHLPSGGSGDPQGFEVAVPTPYAGYTDYLQSSADYGLLSKAFDMTFSSSHEAFGLASNVSNETSSTGANQNYRSAVGGGGSTTPITANSSPSSTSEEAVGEEDSAGCEKYRKKNEEGEEELGNKEAKGGEDGDHKAKIVSSKTKKKGEKRQREPRFAFMTKSEVDHLEDGYRWRKYGQKAVKNSPFPRSYYRCTTQNCSVKKRVERSYQEPSVVITTYEGQHTHHCPATVRGRSHLLACQTSRFHADLQLPQLSQASPMNSGYGLLQTLAPPLQQLQLPNYGAVLQDNIPSFINSSQP